MYLCQICENQNKEQNDYKTDLTDIDNKEWTIIKKYL